MTELISGFSQPHLGRSPYGSPYESVQDSVDDHWQQHLIEQMPIVAAQWVQQQQGPQVSGMHDFNVVYSHDPNGYVHPQYTHAEPSVISPNLGYPSDMDTARTPSTPGYGETERTSFSHPQSSHLRPPQHQASIHSRQPHSTASVHSHHSSHGSVSPRHSAGPSPQIARPGLHQTASAPEPSALQVQRNSLPGSALKPSSDDDDEYVPSEPSNRGRKRQRIPHTAVERRYRENLNAHLDKLRQTVPSLARRGVDGVKGEGGQGVKPSKCEILNGAIEHIGGLTKEVADLKAENAALRARVDQMQNWYRSNSR